MTCELLNGDNLPLLLVWKHGSVVFSHTFISMLEFVRHLRSFRLNDFKTRGFVANVKDRKPDVGGIFSLVLLSAV